MNIFKYKRANKVKKKKGANANKQTVHEEFNIRKESEKSGADQLKVMSDKFDLLEEIQRQREDVNDEEGYTIDKNFVVKAWKRFRPINSNPEAKRKNQRFK